MHAKLLLALVLILGLVGILLLTPHGLRRLIPSWNLPSYRPERLEAPVAGSFPNSHRIAGVPWISHEKAYCSSTALMMIGNSLGIERGLGYYSWLMGFTYNAYYCPDCDYYIPWIFPSSVDGLAAAAPYLGLRMRYLVTDSKDYFLSSVRASLWQNKPVIINLDGSQLLGYPDIYPHTELLIGYDKSGFTYFETGGSDRYDQQGSGLYIAEAELCDVVLTYNQRFQQPYGYAFIVFDSAEKENDLEAVWRAASLSLVGHSSERVLRGSYALETIASDLENDKLKVPEIVPFLKEASFTRRDNADFLEAFEPANERLTAAASLLNRASELYSWILNALANEQEVTGDSAAQLIYEAAQAERSAGEILGEQE